jgi:hypothetical protein
MDNSVVFSIAYEKTVDESGGIIWYFCATSAGLDLATQLKMVAADRAGAIRAR